MRAVMEDSVGVSTCFAVLGIIMHGDEQVEEAKSN
jgi:hypothetical protein